MFFRLLGVTAFFAISLSASADGLPLVRGRYLNGKVTVLALTE